MITKLYLIASDFSGKMRRENISAHAASTAFFFFLSMGPLLMVICTIIPFTPVTEANLIRAFVEITPNMMDELVESFIKEMFQASAGILSIAILAAIWSASKGILALMRGMNDINKVEENRGYISVRIVATFYTLIMLLGVVLSLILMVFGNHIVELIVRKIQGAEAVADFFLNFRFLLVWLLLTFIFTLIYTFIPSKKLKIREQIPGAAFSAVVWNLFSSGFSIYISKTGSYSIYGSLSIIIVVMLWMYFCMYIILIGAYINL
ncbi:YihY/virulence factor BrkB family protein, partial [Lachnospiraceae bacterium OttesenSCG-928-D06]|nr:YihY/virulence factor BrkB family protein [Lachnospiraceae bacterium OttesenSCG-928-D06]